MKKNLLILFLLMPFFTPAQVQWNQSGDNSTTGRVIISGSTTSTDYDDIVITRNKTNAGIKLLNANLTGRSVILFGNDYGGKYGFLAHHAQSYSAGTGYSLSYKPSSTILVGADVNGLGIISTNDIRFNAGGDDDAKLRMIINAAGFVGIGTASPLDKLHVNGNLSIQPDDSNTPSYINFKRTSDGWVAARMGQVYSQFNYGGHLVFETNSGSAATNLVERMRITYDGNVGIGTTNTQGYKLAIAGKTITEEVVVKLQGSWPDYVFENNYKLPSLSELEQYIKTNKHLPDVPTASEVKENGLSVGEMNAVLLKKVEELTMYVIEQNKIIKKQNEGLTKLENN